MHEREATSYLKSADMKSELTNDFEVFTQDMYELKIVIEYLEKRNYELEKKNQQLNDRIEHYQEKLKKEADVIHKIVPSMAPEWNETREVLAEVVMAYVARLRVELEADLPKLSYSIKRYVLKCVNGAISCCAHDHPDLPLSEASSSLSKRVVGNILLNEPSFRVFMKAYIKEHHNFLES
jgi:hypothetical protein